MRGIRFRVTLLAAGVLSIMLFATTLVLLGVQRRLLTDNLDESLATHASALLDNGNGETGTIAARGDDDSIAQITTLDGDIVSTTANFATQPALPPPQHGDSRQLRTVSLFAGEPPFRVLSVRTQERIVHVGSPTDDIDESINTLRRALAGTIPIVALALAALIWWLIGRALSPVEAIRSEVANISGQNLHRRVPEPGSNDEIQRLASTMNEMLDRVERSAETQRRFVADASRRAPKPTHPDPLRNRSRPRSPRHRRTHRHPPQRPRRGRAHATTGRRSPHTRPTRRRSGIRPTRRAVDLEAIVKREVNRQSASRRRRHRRRCCHGRPRRRKRQPTRACRSATCSTTQPATPQVSSPSPCTNTTPTRA